MHVVFITNNYKCRGINSMLSNLYMLHIADINECAADMGGCIPPELCLNTLGSFQCICPVGYIITDNTSLCEGKKLLLWYVI